VSTTPRYHRWSLMGSLIVSALSLCALAVPLSPAKAQCVGVDLGFGCAGLGVGSWYTAHPYYYGSPAYYGYPAYPPAYVDPGYTYTPAGHPEYENK
jgi:hypothetical protein